MLNSDQTDMLAELLNIAFGQAASPLARLVGRFVVLTPPEVSSVRRAGAMSWLHEQMGGDSTVHVVQQSFHPTLRGEAMMVMRADNGAHAWGLFADPDDEPDELEERDAALEVANLLVGACIGRLAELLGTSVRYSPPQLSLFSRPLSDLTIADHPDATLLVIHTRFTVEETAFESYVFLVLAPDVFGWLCGTLDRLIDGYMLEDEALGHIPAEANVAR